MAEDRFSTLVPDGLVREDVALLCDLLCDCAPHGGRTPADRARDASGGSWLGTAH